MDGAGGGESAERRGQLASVANDISRLRPPKAVFLSGESLSGTQGLSHACQAGRGHGGFVTPTRPEHPLKETREAPSRRGGQRPSPRPTTYPPSRRPTPGGLALPSGTFCAFMPDSYALDGFVG